MRREGKRDGLQAEVRGVRHRPPQKLPMAKVHPVEFPIVREVSPGGEKFPDPR